jgi:hypothetical protein
VKIYITCRAFWLKVFILLNLSFSALACNVIDSSFTSIGEVISESTTSKIGSPKSLVRLIGPPVNSLAPSRPDIETLHLKLDVVKNQLVVSSNELNDSIVWNVICENGKWLINKNGKSSVDGAYQKYSSKIWLNIDFDGHLKTKHHYSNVSGFIFHDYYDYESNVKFKKH